ncbi:hypothetical protein [Mycobacterium sp. AZCC_0083]|uniref:hypothetical protein n=1 Tax=Mycobacterium sp. AZCC_0083 TaxID=2735882 RepID=UPI00161D9408|nr:hypothetical protein [Mycobacterium sp. AZCC_0083]MBB5167170.1 hypothetical protein [Mycobacterium sp. AZCC_0083]
MPSRAEFLTERNELLELLWELDDELRNWHAGGVWRHSGSAAQSAAYSDKMTQRHMLAQELKAIGCAPWDFNPFRDNCWLVRPQIAA